VTPRMTTATAMLRAGPRAAYTHRTLAREQQLSPPAPLRQAPALANHPRELRKVDLDL
jgi:hypothetical protein